MSLLYYVSGFTITKHPTVALVKSRLTAKYMPNPIYYFQEIDYAHKMLSKMGLNITIISDDALESGSFLKAGYSLLILPNVKNMSSKTVLNIKKLFEKYWQID